MQSQGSNEPALVATLIANPQNPQVSIDIADAAMEAIDASAVYWLADGIACDIPIGNALPQNLALAKLNKLTDKLAIDCIVQPADTRRKRALIADMDSTMIEQECIDELAAQVGIKDKVAGITARAMNGEIEFEPALIERVSLLKGLSISVVDKVIKERITLMPGGPELVATMKNVGSYTALVSGGFKQFTTRIGATLGFDENRANTLVEKEGQLTGEVQIPILGAAAKVTALKEIASERGISAEQFIAVGDGANDLPMLKLAGTGVALHAKPKVAAEANIRIDHGDLTALLYIQGYRKTEFVSNA